MQMFKVAALSLLTCLAIPAFAENKMGGATDKSGHFDELKQHALQNADREAKMIQIFKNCVNAAQNKTALDNCHQNKMDAMHQFHEDNMEHHEEMKEHPQEMKNKH